MEKMTKKEMFAEVVRLMGIDNVANMVAEAGGSTSDIIAFANHEIELLEKKSGKSGKTKTQKENDVLVGLVFVALAEVGKPVTVSEFQAESEYASQFSNQKLSALLKKLVDSDRIKKSVEGKKSYFFVPTVKVEDTEDTTEGEVAEVEADVEVESEEVEG